MNTKKIYYLTAWTSSQLTNHMVKRKKVVASKERSMENEYLYINLCIENEYLYILAHQRELLDV